MTYIFLYELSVLEISADHLGPPYNFCWYVLCILYLTVSMYTDTSQLLIVLIRKIFVF